MSFFQGFLVKVGIVQRQLLLLRGFDGQVAALEKEALRLGPLDLLTVREVGSAAASGGAEAERGAFFDENGEYNETFAKDFWDRGWEATTLIGNPNGDYFDLGPSRLSFKLPVTEVYEFVTHTGSLTEDVLVEATFENVRSTEARMS